MQGPPNPQPKPFFSIGLGKWIGYVFVIDINTETFFWLAQLAPFITMKHPIYHLLD